MAKEKIPSTKMAILRDTYKLFLTNNLEKVTIVELEQACQKVRGTIFYHYKSKQILFEEVIEKLFFPSLDIPTTFNQSYISLNDFLCIYKTPEERSIEEIKNTYNIENPEIWYFNFLSQAYKYYPSFQEKYNQIINTEIKFLNSVVKQIDQNSSLTDMDKKKMVYTILLMGTGLSFNRSFLPESDLSLKSILREDN